jgi:DNA polymerase III epsilon subunit-like protein
MTFVYLDLETTGLDPQRHEAWEVAWAVDEGPVRSGILNHSLRNADPAALEIGHYHERHDGPPADEGTLLDDLHAATLVGANPAFDAGFLRARWGVTPWRYRLLDVEAYAMPLLKLSEPKGLAYVAEQLRDMGHDIYTPDHSARADVLTLRDCHRALRAAYGLTDE